MKASNSRDVDSFCYVKWESKCSMENMLVDVKGLRFKKN